MSKKEFFFGVFVGFLISGLGVIYYLNLEKPATSQNDTTQDASQEQMTQALQEEIKKLETQLKDDPENVKLLTTLGNYYFDTGNTKMAIATYEKVLNLEPDNTAVWVDCGVMYRRDGDFKKSIDYFNKALSIDSTNQQALFNKVIVFKFDLNDINSAQEAFNVLENISPNNPHIEAFRAELGL